MKWCSIIPNPGSLSYVRRPAQKEKHEESCPGKLKLWKIGFLIVTSYSCKKNLSQMFGMFLEIVSEKPNT